MIRENYKLRRTTEMTTLAEDIKALMDLGHGLGSATKLAVEDRKRATQPGNYLHPVMGLIFLWMSLYIAIYIYIITLYNHKVTLLLLLLLLHKDIHRCF